MKIIAIPTHQQQNFINNDSETRCLSWPIRPLFRLSSDDEGKFKFEWQGLFTSGGVDNPFDKFLLYLEKIKNLNYHSLKLTRVDVASDVYGVTIDEAFPSPKSKMYKWNFPFKLTAHDEKKKDTDLKFTGFSIRLQRWSLTIYDKRIELENSDQHQIKKSYFDTFSKLDEPITRIELKLKTSEALKPFQGFLQTACKEVELCDSILKHWGDEHRIKTKAGNDEARFHDLFRNLKKTTYQKQKATPKVAGMYDDFVEIKIRDKARNYIRQALKAGKSIEDLTCILKDQIEWLSSCGEINESSDMASGHPSKGDRKGGSVYFFVSADLMYKIF